jgi:hypothetical protein
VRLASLLLAPVLAAAVTLPAAAQPTPERVEPSGRATTQVTVTSRAAGAQPAAQVVKIDYGQPHARGRTVAGGLVPYDQVWRTGANSSTTLTTDVDLEIGGARVPKGSYSLYSLLTRAGWKLVVNRQTGQWGTQYDAGRDLARVDMTLRQLPAAAAAESFTMTLVPSGAAPLQGTLAMSWGTLHGTVPWRVAPTGRSRTGR